VSALRLAGVGLLLFAMTVTPSEAAGRHGGGGHHGGSHHHGRSHGHGSVVVGIGPWWGPGWSGGWPYYGYSPYYSYYPYSYYPYSYYPGYPYYPPTVSEPSTYIQLERAIQSTPQLFWYYCESAAGYYPAVQSCPESWLPVTPRQQ
jgi:hypothetical protein